MLVKKLLNVCLGIVLFFSPTYLQAAGPICSDLFFSKSPTLDSVVSKLFVQKNLSFEIQQFENWQKKVVILAMKKRISEQILNDCKTAGCTEKDIARSVEQSIVKTFASYDEFKLNIKRIRGYAVLTGLSVGIAISSHFIKGRLPAADQWMSDFVTIASSIGLYKLGAPLWDYLSGVISRGAFRVKDGKSFFRDENEMARYEENYRILQEKMTLREQQETSRIASLLNSTESMFSSAIESIQSKDSSKGGLDRAAARIALSAIKLRKFFPEISTQDPDLLRTVQMSFTQFLPMDSTRQILYDKIIDQIQKNDLHFQDEVTAEIYKTTIKLWLGI